jgi:hypothetical protein
LLKFLPLEKKEGRLVAALPKGEDFEKKET